MKKFFTLALVCCLVFSSSSIAFATATQWDTSDSQHLTGIYNSLVSTSSSGVLKALNQIYTVLTSTTSQSSMYAIALYLYDIREYAREIASGLNGTSGSFLEKIFNALTHTDAAGIVYSYVTDIYQKVTEIDNTVLTIGSRLSSILTQATNTASNTAGIYAYSANIDSNLNTIKTNDILNGFEYFNGGASVTYRELIGNGVTQNAVLNLSQRNWRTNLVSWMNYLTNSTTRGFSFLTNGFADSRSLLNWTTLQSNTFTPKSTTNGIYTYLAGIQNPIARLAYVHASDEEIEARQKAEANQTAVVDNFIDSSGSGAAAPSDFGSVSDLSSGFKDNIVTDASVSGIWNIFNSDNFGWFSQETADQLDTSKSSSRMLKSSGLYPTPLLDQQTEDILNYLGGK